MSELDSPFMAPAGDVPEPEIKLKKKFNFLVLLLPLLLLVIAGGFVYFPDAPVFKRVTEMIKQEGNLTTVPSVAPSQQNKLTNQEIAQETLAWLDKQRDDRGVYHVSRACDFNNKKCDEVLPAGTSAHSGLPAIWGVFKNFQITGARDTLEIVNRDINVYSNNNMVSYLNNDFWNCKLMYEMWQNDSFTIEQKVKIEDLCFNSKSTYYSPPDLREKVDLELKDNLWQEVVKGEIVPVDINNPSFESSLSETDKDVNVITFYTSATSEFLSRYNWKKSENDLLKAKYFFNKSFQLYSMEKSLLKNNELCLFGISSVDYFKFSKGEKYLNLSKLIFDQLEKNNSLNQPVCAIFANDLFVATKDNKYKENRKVIVKNMIEQTYDFSGYGGLLEGNGSFLTTDEQKISFTKIIRNNGLALGVLSYE